MSHPQWLKNQLFHRLVPAYTQDNFHQTSGEGKASIAVREATTHWVYQGQLATAVYITGNMGAIFVVVVGKVIAGHTAGVVKQLANGNYSGRVFVRNLKISQVTFNRGIKIDVTLLHQCHDQAGGEYFGDGTNLKNRVGGGFYTGIQVENPRGGGGQFSLFPNGQRYGGDLMPNQ